MLVKKHFKLFLQKTACFILVLCLFFPTFVAIEQRSSGKNKRGEKRKAGEKGEKERQERKAAAATRATTDNGNNGILEHNRSNNNSSSSTGTQGAGTGTYYERLGDNIKKRRAPVSRIRAEPPSGTSLSL